MKFSISTFWDSRAVDSSKLSRVMLSINLPSKSFFVTIRGLKCSRSDYDKSFTPKSISDVQREIKSVIDLEILKADTILKRLADNASKELFLKYYKSGLISSTDKTDLFKLWDELIADLYAENRFGGSDNNKHARDSFFKFRPKIFLEDIDEKFLKDYRKYMLENNRSVSTVGIYVRALRSLYQQCIKDGLIVVKVNPFLNVSVGWTVASKSVLYPEQLKALWEYQPDGLMETRAKDFFFFCYLGNGINPKDVSELKVKNVKNDMIVFVRQKTKGTQQTPKEVMIYIDDEIRRILNLYGSKSTNPNDYLFDWFNKCKDLKHHNATFKRFKGTHNSSLKKIAAKLKMGSSIYLGIARHSFATKHKLDGTPTSYISEFMGHSNQKTTESYMKSLPSDVMKGANSKLLSFG
ncbi:MAG: site-specific integrase [Ferruginibacter sp.]|nr:site-specific integrase [Ferruginibacter sp.]